MVRCVMSGTVRKWRARSQVYSSRLLTPPHLLPLHSTHARGDGLDGGGYNTKVGGGTWDVSCAVVVVRKSEYVLHGPHVVLSAGKEINVGMVV